MSSPIHRHARARPEAPAVIGPARRWTYAELDRAVVAARRRMADDGIQSGDRVAFAPSRTVRSVLLLWALWRAGAVAVPLSTRLPRAAQNERAEGVGADVFLSEEKKQRLVGGPPTDAGAGAVSNPGSRAPDRDATIVFTSGTTGTPKAALHTWANHLYSAKGSNANLPLRPGDRWLLSLPLYHVGGLAILVRCALAGAAVAVPLDQTSLYTALANSEATHVSCVSTQLRRLVDATEVPPRSLRAVLLGGGPLPTPLLNRAHERAWPLLTSYGCTEMASQVATTAPGAPQEDLSTAGSCLPHRRLQIGADGQILVRGRTLFQGYVQDATLQDPRGPRGWYPTGDRGRLDAQGRLHVLGRMDHMFVSGGENIQPEEIEGHLERLDGVERAVVVPVPSEEYGHRPVAFLRAATPFDGQRLRRALADTLPRFKIPDAFYSLPEEMDAAGRKPDRSRLRSRARDEQDG